MRILITSVIVLLIASSCKGPELMNRYHSKIQECIELRISEKSEMYGLIVHSDADGGFERVLHEFEETLLKLSILSGKKENDYQRLIKSINQVAFDTILEAQKLNQIQNSYGLLAIEYTQNCPANVLDESFNHRKIIALKTTLDRLSAEGGVPNQKYLGDFIEFVNFDNDSSRLFYTYLIFLNLKYFNV